MHVVQAGPHKLIQLELDPEVVTSVAKQAGFDATVSDSQRVLSLEIRSGARPGPLLLFDAADPANLGWFSRCQFYVDGRSGAVLQTPMAIANLKDRTGRVQPDALRIQLSKELPVTFRLPGKSPVTEQMVYAVFQSFLHALTGAGVGVCGGSIIRPLAGRTEAPGMRN